MQAIYEVNGYWSKFRLNRGFFPVYRRNPCSDGQVTLNFIDEIKLEQSIVDEISKRFDDSALETLPLNRYLISKYKLLSDGKTLWKMVKILCKDKKK